ACAILGSGYQGSIRTEYDASGQSDVRCRLIVVYPSKRDLHSKVGEVPPGGFQEVVVNRKPQCALPALRPIISNYARQYTAFAYSGSVANIEACSGSVG